LPGRAGALKQTYTAGARRLATQSIGSLARTRVTPNALTTSGVLLCAAASVLVYFEARNEVVYYWTGATVFVIGSLLDILDGALARVSGKGTPFGAFLDSTTDRISEGFMLGAIALVFTRQHNVFAVAAAFGAVGGSFLVSYTRARAEALGVECKVGIADRPVRVVILSIGLVLAKGAGIVDVELLAPAVYVLAALSIVTVVQRIWHVRQQLIATAPAT
jgi:CDP-diacylglycerol---glycerol-3-phosphate 3-phosphatidyltransferase